jgi:hypothetical protein
VTGAGPFDAGSRGARRTGELQIPDQCVRRAADKYARGLFAEALEEYVEAIDKLHTMYVVGEMAYRRPSADDSAAVGGLASSVRTARAAHPDVDLRRSTERACHYLNEIAQAALSRGFDPSLYESGITLAMRELDRVPGTDPASGRDG